MTKEEILMAINSDLPEIACEAGCVECCSVAVWSLFEWSRVPEEMLEKVSPLGSVNVPMRVFGNRKVMSLLPVYRQRIMEIASRKKMAVTEWTIDKGLLLTSHGLNGVSCIFKEEGKGCMVYEYRPFVCRIMGTTNVSGTLHCPKGIECKSPLPESIIMQRFLLYTNLFENDPRYTEKKS